MNVAHWKYGILICTDLDAPEDAYELGIDDAFADALSIIEWPENLGSLLPPAHLRITLQQAAGDDSRKIAFEG